MNHPFLGMVTMNFMGNPHPAAGRWQTMMKLSRAEDWNWRHQKKQILVGKHKANTKKRWIVFADVCCSSSKHVIVSKDVLLITLFFMFIPSQVQISVCSWYKCCLTDFPPDHFRQVHSIKSQAAHFMIAPKWPRKAWHPIYVVFVDTEFQPKQSFKLIAVCEIYTLVNKHRPWK